MISNIMEQPLIKLLDNVKIYDKFVLQTTIPVDTILLENETGSIIQEIIGNFLLEEQQN